MGRFDDFHDAGAGVVGFNFVKYDSIFPFGADFAVDDALDVSVFRVSATVDDAQNAQACDEEVVNTAFNGFGCFFGGEPVEVNFVFGVREFPSGRIAAHFFAACSALRSGFSFGLSLNFSKFVFVLHGVIFDPL